MGKKYWRVFFLLAIMISGCGEPEVIVVTPAEKEKLLVERLRLPPDAKNVVMLDENWHTFELVIDGRTRKFLRRAYMLGEGKWRQDDGATDTLTELIPQ